VSLRRVGVEEELLLTDPETGQPLAVSERAMRAAPAEPGLVVEQELFLQQIETGTGAHESLQELERDICRSREVAAEAAAAAGATVVAVATPVFAAQAGLVTPKDRYQAMVDRFGAVAREQIVCGMHVHVDVADADEGIGAFDRIRPWLPVLLALSGNSPYWRAEDTGYASWRTQVWKRWPTAGPTEPFRDAGGYRRATEALLATGAAMDRGMLYFDARPSQRYPTLELRTADVCTDVADAVLQAALARALVETGIRAWAAGEPVPPWRTELLRAATWRASRYGLSERLVHPETGGLAEAGDVVAALLDHISAAVGDSGDAELVRALADRALGNGGGAAKQRAVAADHDGDLTAVVADLRRRTEASWQEA